MKKTLVIKIGSLALGAVAAFCFTFGTPAKACNVPLPGSSQLIVPDIAAIVAAQGAAAQTSETGEAEASVEKPGERDVHANVSANNAGTITGLWQITFYSGPYVVDAGFDVWHSDGTEMLNDTPPPATGNVCVGVWQQATNTTYRLKHPSWTFDNNGNLTGTAVIRETVTISSSKNSFSGPYTIDFYDNSGHSTGHYTGTVQATRIVAN